MNQTRRDFIKMISASAAGIMTLQGAAVNAVSMPYPVCLFSKCLQFLNHEELGEVMAEMGFNGADLTISKGGQINPDNVKTDLPKAVQALRKSGIEVPMIVTGINDAEDRLTEDILGTASDLGIKYYRMGKYWYDPHLTVFENLDNCKRKLEKLELINRSYNIKGGYQNHSGPWGMVGGAVWDLHYMLKEIDPGYLGVQYDIMHATAEGGFSWLQTLEVIFPWINSLAFKDFLWEWNQKKARWETKIVPLGKGMVDFEKYIRKIEPILYSVPVTIHCEYDLGGAESGDSNPSMSKEELCKLLKNDLEYFKNNIIAKRYGNQ